MVKGEKLMLKKGHNIYKAEKLLRILLEYEEDQGQKNIRTIDSIRITGDFFVYPEDSLEKLEKHLKGIRLEKEMLKKEIDICLNKAEPFGFDSESLADAIMGCLGSQRAT